MRVYASGLFKIATKAVAIGGPFALIALSYFAIPVFMRMINNESTEGDVKVIGPMVYGMGSLLVAWIFSVIFYRISGKCFLEVSEDEVRVRDGIGRIHVFLSTGTVVKRSRYFGQLLLESADGRRVRVPVGILEKSHKDIYDNLLAMGVMGFVDK
ncbi:MAG: hypothetical protein EA401_01410 [Planctomycetota bacterium]|nr:MAG: hypothetical protein EA401_01410 [Planctomycetota bacterium]